MQRYNPKEIEPKWQAKWAEDKIYEASEDPAKPKRYILEYFPYPSGAAMHVGHVRNYTIGDVVARHARMQGMNVLHPMGWDAFGLPAENYAIKTGISPQQAIADNTGKFKQQLTAMGFSYDWSREFASSDPDYYRWTQWFFLLLYKRGLAYNKEALQWWCPIDKTVLANEQVENGHCWRCGSEVEKKALKQWFFKITDYADRLAKDLDEVDWSDGIKQMQRNWIGRSTGAEIDFSVISTTKPNFVILHGYTGRADKGWLPWLKARLESDGYSVQVPQMPNTDAPVESEQVKYVLENCKFDENTVLIGHSLGGVVAMKVLEKLSLQIKKLVLVAPAMEVSFRSAEDIAQRPFLKTFNITYDYEKIIASAGSRIVLSDNGEADHRLKYLNYLADKIDAPLFETDAEKRHFTSEKKPFILDKVVPKLTVFTTRPDTLYGVTYMVVAPEHPILDTIVSDSHKQQVANYQQKVRDKSDIERQETNREKTGVFTGAYAINPINGEKLPIWTADYVLGGYGTGAIMAVPSHDERDYAFAKQFDLPIKFVVEPTFGEPQGDDVQSEKIYAVLRNPKNQTAMVLNWGPRQKNYGGNMLIGGTVEGGEEHQVAAAREIYEETGYKNIRFVKEAKFKGHGYFYSNVKDLNVHASGKGMLFDLVDEERDGGKLDEGEKEKFTLEWQPIDKIAGLLDDGVHEAMFRYLALDEPYHGEGVMINSGPYDGMSSSEARKRVVEDLSRHAGEDNPLFEETSQAGKPRADKPTVERQAITAIVKHWSEDKYIGLKWKKVDWDTLITGGIEEGQTAKTAAMAEIQEETGFLHPVLKQHLGKNRASFFHVPKDENRLANFDCLYFELADGEREDIAQAEQQNHEVVWLTPEEMADFRLPASHRYVWNKLQGDMQPRAKAVVNYRMRDWLISRQRYWGAPIPMIHCPKDGIVPVPEDQLPVVLPELKSFEPSGDGRSPLANVPEFVNVTCPECGGPAERETDTMDGFACSSWYFLRFADPHNSDKPFDADKVKFWLSVDDYIGGAEHAVMHLLYARMWTKVMQDAGLIDFGEPFKALRNHGMILAPDGQKMSKSKGNTIQPDELIDQGYGADSIRIMELFIGPWNQTANWSVEGMGGSYRFLQRIWNLVYEQRAASSQHNLPDDDLQRATHRTVKKVSDDLAQMGFNTAIAALMELVNELYKIKVVHPLGSHVWKNSLETVLRLLAPFAPHISEELWYQLGNETSVHLSEWPAYDEKYLVQDTVTIAVQVNGKLRGTIQTGAGSDEAAATELAKVDAKVAANLEAKQIVKTIYVPNKLLNFVVK